MRKRARSRPIGQSERVRSNKRLIRVENSFELSFSNTMGDQENQRANMNQQGNPNPPAPPQNPPRISRSSCIVLPAPPQNFEIKSGTLRALQEFHGYDSENPYDHIRDFEAICGTVKITNMTDDEFRLRVFPFSLKDRAKTWLNSLPPASITSWEQMTRLFFKKFYPKLKTTLIRQTLNSFAQKEGESLYKYLERFNDLLNQCPHHGFDKMRLVQILYEGLDYPTTSMVESLCVRTTFLWSLCCLSFMTK